MSINTNDRISLVDTVQQPNHTYREFYFDSDYEQSVTGDLTDYTTDVLEEVVTDINLTIYHGVLKEVKDTIQVHSDRYRNGWSPECNNSTEAFLKDFQDGYINWKKFYPNIRIPRSHTTNTRDLCGCLVIEVDLENGEERVESTNDTI